MENIFFLFCSTYLVVILSLVVFLIKALSATKAEKAQPVSSSLSSIPTQQQNSPERKEFAWKSDKEMLSAIKNLSPHEFEEFVGKIFQQLGYSTNVIGGLRDGGIDIIVKKGEKTHYIQCKKYINRVVTLSDMRDFYGAIVDKLNNANAYFVTTNIFTLDAKRFASERPIRLINGYELVSIIKKYNVEIPLRPEINRDPVKFCNKCDSRMKIVEGKYGIFWGCTNFPKCKNTQKMDYFKV